MFEDIMKNIKIASKELKELQDEVERLSKGEKSEVKNKRAKLEPMTKLRGSAEEVNQEKENPELTKIQDKLESIIEGIFK